MKRAAFRQQVEVLPVEKLVFLDECGFSLNLHRLYGWTIGGKRCTERVPFNKGANRSVVGAFSLPSAVGQHLGAGQCAHPLRSHVARESRRSGLLLAVLASLLT